MKAEYAKRVTKWVSNDSILLRRDKKMNMNNLLTFRFFASARALCREKERYGLTF